MLTIEKLQVRADASKRDLLIDGFSLTVKHGEVVGLMGPSGCGKTTLLRTIVGLIDPAGGSVMYEGKSPQELGWPEFRRRVSLVAQRPVVWDGSVCENLLRPTRFDTIKRQLIRADAEHVLKQVGMDDLIDVDATTLSEGERQRVCLARAVLAEPNFLVLDEPTSALDDGSVGRVEGLLRELMTGSDDAGILVATHDRAFAERFCTRVIDLAKHMPAGKGVADA